MTSKDSVKMFCEIIISSTTEHVKFEFRSSTAKSLFELAKTIESA